MKAYAATENWEALTHYLDLLDEDLTTVDTVIKTGNPMTDAILNSKISLAKSKNIQVIADAHIPVKLTSSEIDLCCIIGNLFDNAIDASLKLPEEHRLSKNIQVIADAHIPVKLTSSEIDLCCIIGNLFDNAIDASLKLPEEHRLIRIYMDMKNTQLYISFTNFTAEKKMKKEGNLFRSTKGAGHGFGLARIDAIVERQEGYISRNSEDGAFTTEILLPQL